MKIKKIIITLIVLIILAVLSLGVYTYFIAEDKTSTLTMAEKQWIEENKNTIIDLGIINNIPVFNNDGEGVFFDFIQSIETDTGLEFNKLSFSYGSNSSTAYSFNVVDEVGNNDLLLYNDNYVILSSNDIKYNNLKEIESMTLGLLQTDVEKASYYLMDNENIAFKTYENIKDLLAGLVPDKNGNAQINAILLPKTIYLEEIFINNLKINYNVTDMTKNIVLTLGNTKKLNTIIKKYYEKWQQEQYETSFNEYFTNYYLEMNNIGDDDTVKFKSKQYKYGFVGYAPYDDILSGKLIGLNSEILASFANTAGIEIKYQSEYNSSKDLSTALNENKIDLYFNNLAQDDFDIDVYNTKSVFDEEIVVLAQNNTNFIVNSLSSLSNYNVMTIKDTKISSKLKELDIKITEYNSIESMLNQINQKSLIVIDEITYEAYKLNELNQYKEIYETKLDNNYTYIIRDINANKVFIQYFDFYLSFINEKEFYNQIDYSLFAKAKTNNLYLYIGLLALVAIVILFILILSKNKKNKTNKITASVGKENKLKYIDMLTSLKNRNYLNDSIEKWDESEIYPQAIIIIDLNNVAYINDNYGHAEGDSVIKEAANIMFKNQIENSEIMRTNGNEFLIYLVEYDEKQVISYIRKLNKEFKDLSHGFGAAVGYSMITDGLKTVDDAINEATLDMRTNKEEANG
ncbi:MAG: GGDEF domain-containing protein [Bacilli bacterium]|nr:GGDEF domain-containing protein [Bacilli bacterium]